MRTQTIEYKVFKFEELSKDAQEQALNNNRHINVEHDWWDFTYEHIKEEILKPIGITCDKFFFSVDRNYYIYMDNPTVLDERVFLKAAGIDLRTKIAKHILEYGFDINIWHCGGGYAQNGIELFGYCKNLDTTEGELTKFLRRKLNEGLDLLTKTCDNLMEDEWVKETIQINEYEFLNDGQNFIGHFITCADLEAQKVEV